MELLLLAVAGYFLYQYLQPSATSTINSAAPGQFTSGATQTPVSSAPTTNQVSTGGTNPGAFQAAPAPNGGGTVIIGSSGPSLAAENLFYSPARNIAPLNYVDNSTPMPDMSSILNRVSPAQAAADAAATAAATPILASPAPTSVQGYAMYLGPGQYHYSLTPQPGYFPAVIPTQSVDPGGYA